MAAAEETIGLPKLIRPESPRTLKESGLTARCVEGLVLKTIKQHGAQTIESLSEHMHLTIHVFREMVLNLNHREILDTPAPQTYDLTNKGRELTHFYEIEDQYVGPAPVSFEAYRAMVLKQAQRHRRITQEEFEQQFANLPAPKELKNLLREAYNGGEVMILWGPPGAGKSMWSGMLQQLMEMNTLLPYAFEYNGRSIKIFEPAYHKLKEEAMKEEEAATAELMTTSGKPDRRWLISSPPYVMVGSEFRTEMMQVSYDGQYDAPPHVKANNGIFLFDDLGRQTQDHNMILNQFIQPLETKETIVRISGGATLRLPYRQRLILSTNLNFRAIIDDAFARRLLYQILVDRPTDEGFKQIFVNVGKGNGIDEPLMWESARKVLGWYKRDGRAIRGSDSRDIFRMLGCTLDEGEVLKDRYNLELLERVYFQYPVAKEKDATGYVVPRSTKDEFKARLTEVMAKWEIDARLAAKLVEKAAEEWLDPKTRLFRPSDPTNLLWIADGTREPNQTVKDYLTEATFEPICRNYPSFTEADARRMEGTTGLAGK